MANKKTPNINLRGVRARIPRGYLLGRSDTGDGRVQLIGQRELATLFNTAGVGAATNPPPPATINFFGQGLLLANEFLGQLNFTKSILFLQNLPSGQGSCLTAPADANQSLILQKNLTTFATVDYAQTTGTTSTFTCAADTQFDATDIMTLWAPAVADSAWADISFSIQGTPL
tara:strand:+ start:330 stop:848 length:519 start_codon:yes stop_codon:yes gene_type:complete